ncbi:hypothetical protein ABEB36_012973 [Hypothenemus hampei]|uniref:G-patch domain-containing protein n=1 Tax=Hypothenemus hampei TaxID=57062 RepID=A0ABD1E7A0_HYPHA
MESMKISFGFSKLSKKTNLISNKLAIPEGKVELIECLEGQSIKVKDAVEEVKQPLIIPLKDNQKNLLDRVREAKKNKRIQQVDAKGEEIEDTRPDSELTADELAARQLLIEAKQRLEINYTTSSSKISVLPVKEDKPSFEGEKESSLEDYESVPISDYGLALLRGMGWKEGMGIGRNVSKTASVSVPELRPKGLGLGASKLIQKESNRPQDKDGNELVLKTGAFAKVIAGPQKDNYCEVQGFDEDAGRVVVKVYPKGEILNINEIMLMVTTKEEFCKNSRVINNAKYKEYKDLSETKLKQSRSSSEEKVHIKKEKDDEDKKYKSSKHTKSRKKDRSQSKERHRKHYEDSSDSDRHRKRNKCKSRHKKSSNKY